MAPDQIAAKRREVADRYKRKRRTRPQLVGLRVKDLNRLLTARYGEVLPNDDAGMDDATIVAHHLAQYVDGNPVRRIKSWVSLRAPWMTIGDLDALIAEAITRPKRWRADKLAWRLRLTAAERKTLRITTIGAIDAPKSQREHDRLERERQRKQAKRRATGARPRAEYEAKAISRQEPWKAAGISRRTWYRRQSGTVAQVR